MGSAASKTNGNLAKTQKEIVALMMPVYYSPEAITDEEVELASETWKSIVHGTAAQYLSRRSDPTFSHVSCIMFFYNSFYERLFDVHPFARDLFKDVNSQGKFLAKMISLSLSEKADPVKYEQTLRMLAEIHNERGVKAVEYGMVGEVLFWAIRQCIGVDSYTNEVHQAWVKIYSRMLRTMVPVAVAYELKDGSAQAKRFYGDFMEAKTDEPGCRLEIGRECPVALPAKPRSTVRLNEAHIPPITMN